MIYFNRLILSKKKNRQLFEENFQDKVRRLNRLIVADHKKSQTPLRCCDILEGIKCHLMVDSRYLDICPLLMLAMYVLVDRNELALMLPTIRSNARSSPKIKREQSCGCKHILSITGNSRVQSRTINRY